MTVKEIIFIHCWVDFTSVV